MMGNGGDGFVANRSRTPFGAEINLRVEEGALPEQVDKVMVDFGYPIGPFATADLSRHAVPRGQTRPGDVEIMKASRTGKARRRRAVRSALRHRGWSTCPHRLPARATSRTHY